MLSSPGVESNNMHIKIQSILKLKRINAFLKFKATCIIAIFSLLKVQLRLDLVNIIVRPLLFPKLSLFTKSSLDKVMKISS